MMNLDTKYKNEKHFFEIRYSILFFSIRSRSCSGPAHVWFPHTHGGLWSQVLTYSVDSGRLNSQILHALVWTEGATRNGNGRVAVFSNPGGSSTAGQKIPARDSESPEEERPVRGTPKARESVGSGL
jgi:hypothetical protein